ncbi:MAG: SDR family NAD(P)-dependent oxidoreductase [Acidimicrobiales bacterium]
MTETRDVLDTAPASSLSGKVAIVTGAAKGLGVAITRDLARHGANLVLTARNRPALQRHADALDANYNHRESLVALVDVLDEDSVRRLMAETVERFGGIDILVNTAGGTGPIETPAQEVSLEGFRAVLELNVLGTFLPCKHAIPYMIPRGNGRIVNFSGTSGLRGYRNRVGYSSSKWAVRGLTRTLALELGQYGITVNAICPNVTHGERMTTIIAEKAKKTGSTPEMIYEEFAAQTALGRFVDDVDVAATVSFLVSEGARNITGHDIVVDAGWDV